MRLIAFALILVCTMLAKAETGSIWVRPNVASSLTIHTGSMLDAYVTIHPDGTVEYGKDYTPDAAAKALWDAVGVERKARNCPADGTKGE
jgi:hypothetical protein